MTGSRTRRFKWPAAVLAVVIAYWLGGLGGDRVEHVRAPGADDVAAEGVVWICAMHPHIHLPEPGPCPICGMDLVPIEGDAVDDQDWSLEMSDAARRLAEIETAPVERRHVAEEVRMVGKVAYDETRLKTISARFGGRLDRLYVDYTGLSVKQGDHLVWLYSPDLFTAQEELLEAMKRAASSERERSRFLRESNARALVSARTKLRLWGLSDDQIEEIEERGTADDHIMIGSPVRGIITEKWVKEGDYVETGTKIYTVADLDHVWVELDAYESNLIWLRYGQEVDIEADAYPGAHFPGRISFIDPILDEHTRTVRVRVNVENRDRRLKPGMFVRAVVHSSLAEGGKVMDPGLAGKWIGPMHPEVVRDRPGLCPVCEMPLVQAEELGFVSSDEVAFQPLVVPVTAVLRTGKRAVVYVERPDADRPTYEGRVVELGPRAGDHYIVEAGLREGERVVVNGNFKIDSALQIQARPSMMSPPATRPATRPAAVARTSAGAAQAVASIYEAYFDLAAALAGDDLAAATLAFARLDDASAVTARDDAPLASAALAEPHKRLQVAGSRGRNARDLSEARVSFHVVSKAVLALEHVLGHAGTATHYEMHCPMVFDGAGASWLQRSEEIENPYFGDVMLSCGSIEQRFGGGRD